MRREIFRMESRRALALLARAPAVHLATTTPVGTPVLRALDAAVLEDGVYFHGARAGEKGLCLGRRAVVSAEELVAHVPSWMIHPTHACPASTLYRSVQVHGTLREVTDPAMKARALEALMRRWQPEGRYDPIDPADPHYAGELGGTLVIHVPFERVDGKEKLCQNRRPEEIVAVLVGLWERGGEGDAEAIEAIRAANPAVPAPPFLAAEGFRLHAALPEEDLPAVEALLAGEYWWEGQPRAWIGPAHRAASAWVGARAPDGALAASARAVSDGKTAWLYDVVVAAGWRGRGLGKRLVALLLDHPAVRRVPFVLLRTRDAQGLYARFGFADSARQPRLPGSSEMVLRRAPAAAGAPP
jgi:nitroimidazol reductase NimA-like FMN-containing flavoprotein (pyridoxamine 5'-phosphate oxidase superfamily)/ribosomal protein S18 acetylase RimI-like enzyme